jgi:hypothetical protein
MTMTQLTVGLGILLGVTCLGMEFQTQSVNHLKDCVEGGAAFAGKSLIEAFAGESRIAGNLRHASGTGDIAKGLCDKRGISVCLFKASFKIRSHLLRGSEML